MNKVFALAALAVAASGACAAPLSFDQNVTNNVIMGTGIANGGFTVDTAGGVEVGLRARERYPTPNNNFNSNGDGTYSHAAGGYTSGGITGGTRAAWNFDWSINTNPTGAANGPNVGAYTYRLGIDFDAGFGTNYQTFDLINSLAYFDHSFGNNTTAQSAGAEAAAADTAGYAALKAANNLVQNSWNMDFFDDNTTWLFDPNANGNYSFFLEVIEGGQVLARSEIEVIVGTGAVPEPGSLALAGLALFGLAAMRRRKAT